MAEKNTKPEITISEFLDEEAVLLWSYKLDS